MTTFAARGQIWFDQNSRHRSWRYRVTDHRGTVVAWDDCTSYDEIQRLCRQDVAAATRMSQLGQVLRPYAELIEEVSW